MRAVRVRGVRSVELILIAKIILILLISFFIFKWELVRYVPSQAPGEFDMPAPAGGKAKPRPTSVLKSSNSVTGHKNAYAPRNNSAWCPHAKCSNSALCQPCRQRFLFILSTGRAASTTLLGMINHLPNVRLSGENNNALYFLSTLEKQLKSNSGERFFNLRSKASAVPHTDPYFHEEIPEQATACTFQKVLHTLNPPSKEIQQQIISAGSGMGGITLDDYETSQIIGAKMIRIPDGKWTALEASEFFKYNFPCTKYIINTRLNTDKQLASQTRVFKGVGTNITHQNDFLGKFAKHMGEDAAQLIYMEEWTKNVTKFNELVEWLGFQNCHTAEMLHNNKNRYEGDETPIDFGVDCHAP